MVLRRLSGRGVLGVFGLLWAPGGSSLGPDWTGQEGVSSAFELSCALLNPVGSLALFSLGVTVVGSEGPPPGGGMDMRGGANRPNRNLVHLSVPSTPPSVACLCEESEDGAALQVSERRFLKGVFLTPELKAPGWRLSKTLPSVLGSKVVGV